MKPEEKAATLKSVAEYLHKAEQGKSLSVAEKYFCDSMTKYFTEEEVKAAVEEVKKAEADKPAEEEKIEVSKKEFDDMKAELESKTAKVKDLEEAAKKAAEAKPEEKVETREELIDRMNKENGGKDLISLAKERKLKK
jgi:DNA-binding transcriptional regulator GbsR (MarR family)